MVNFHKKCAGSQKQTSKFLNNATVWFADLQRLRGNFTRNDKTAHAREHERLRFDGIEIAKPNKGICIARIRFRRRRP
jgi:hypothetical protein